MKISALASGSSGNAFYIEHKDKAILVDAGISCKQTLSSLEFINQDPKKLQAIFISHEHTDHTKGADVLARTLQIPIFATRGTIKNSFLCSDEEKINVIKSGETISLAGLEIIPINKSHDAIEPVSFMIKNHKTFSILTDCGFTCKNITDAISESDAIILESNHDIDMLQSGPYPYFLKNRILSDQGHLSNLHSALAVLEFSQPKLKNIILAHLSRTNNIPSLALNTFKKILKERRDISPTLSVSTQTTPTPILQI